jgi:hypothetical protein
MRIFSAMVIPLWRRIACRNPDFVVGSLGQNRVADRRM